MMLVRLHKILAEAGVSSRRGGEDLIVGLRPIPPSIGSG
jgi:16S rRNA U516 pseudouridylate synthase RsuA-like enzyme